jgi:hypothetical protein
MYHVLIILLLASLPLLLASRGSSQALILPSHSQFTRGEGICGDFAVGIYSEYWRVKKGDIFELEAVTRQDQNSELVYRWTVLNGKIVSGQGTWKVIIKAGGAKTSGYLNASGFVGITLSVARTGARGNCSLESSRSIMVGQHREVNGRPNVTDLKIDRSIIDLPCASPSRDPETKKTSKEIIIGVSTIAEDPEYDALSYSYKVSAGRILGTGARVMWDLSGLDPGTHSISASVDDGFGVFGKTQTRSVIIKPCKAGREQ